MSQWLCLSPAHFKNCAYSTGGRVYNGIALPRVGNHRRTRWVPRAALALWPRPKAQDLAQLRLGCCDTPVERGHSFPALWILPAITFFIIMNLWQIKKRQQAALG